MTSHPNRWSTDTGGVRWGPPLLIVLSGPSGAGKDSVLQDLKQRMPDIYYAVTVTTRAVRPGEIPGKSYHFIDQATYREMLSHGDLLAAAEVHHNWYGAPLADIRHALASGRDVMLKIDVQGATEVRHRFPQAVFIFLAPPSIEELIVRLRSRGTESPEELERRIRDAESEMAQAQSYDYVVVNHGRDLDNAVKDVASIITAERLRLHRQPIPLGSP